LKNIDRWVVGASLSFAPSKPGCCSCACRRRRRRTPRSSTARQPHPLEPREPQRLCFQSLKKSRPYHPVTPSPRATQRGFRFALERSARRDSQACSTPSARLRKIDGALIQASRATRSSAARAHARRGATKRLIQTIASGGDANTMPAVAGGCAIHPGLFRQMSRRVVLPRSADVFQLG